MIEVMSETDNYSDSASPKELLERAKNEFNREKRLVVKNLPPTTSEKEIRSFMGFNGEFPIEDVAMVKQNNQAIVTLKDPSMVDDAIFMVDNTELNDQVVSVTKYRSDKMLCIAHLPLTMTEYEFRELAAQHGSLEKCFLMRSEDTGCSKGYGFVEYNETIETVGQIKYKLDGSDIQGCVVHCDALTDTSQTGISFQDLHSKCLLIDNLPKDYKDSIKLRELFSSLVKPVYCQIVSKEGESLGFGILEYDKWEDAERACQHFNKHEINRIPINVSFCIPGKSAVHMFTRIMFKYGDTVHVNRASLLPDPVYPNPAFLKHIFFKTHCAKHPRLLVQFTDNLLHLQEGYVRQLEDKTNTKPGILGPAPSIPMSPLMDINLQLGLLSLIVLDMREKGTYSGEVPDPLGKVKIPTEDEFQQKNEPVSLLGDPLTAQANILLRNILMPDSGPQIGLLEKKETVEENEAKLLGKPVKSLNLVHMCSFGRLMAMLTENNQSTGLLGNRPNAPVDTGGPKPLIEGLMQAGKMAQSLLNSMGMGQPKQINSLLNVDLSNMPNNMPNNMMANQGNSNNNAASNAATNFMNTIQNLAMQKMSGSKQGGPQLLNALFGNKSGGDGLLGDYQGPNGQSNQNTAMMGNGPKPLLGMNLGDGLMPTPTNVKSENNFFGNQGNYDDSGYQGGNDDSDFNDGFGDRGFGRNFGNGRGMRGNMGPSGDMRQFGNQGGLNAGNKRFGQQGFRGNQDNMGQNNEINYSMDKDYNNIAQQAAAYAAGAAAAYKQQYEEYMAHAGYGSGYGGYDDNYNYNNNSGYGSDYNNYDYGSNAGYRGGNYGAQSSGSYSTGMSAAGRSSYNSYSSYGSNDGNSRSTGNYGGYNNSNSAGRMGQNGGYNASNNSSGGNFVFGSNSFSGSASATSGYGGSGIGSAGRFGSMGGGFDAQSSRDPRTRGFGTQGLSTGKMEPPLPPGTGPGPSLPGMSTPQGQKRTSMHMLPSPEPSPEGDYIGQHSQGIGGHYADSYTKRQKLVGRFQ